MAVHKDNGLVRVRGATLYVLDEPTTGLHPSDVERLLAQLDGLVAAGNTVIVVEHEMGVVARARRGRTAPYLAEVLGIAAPTREINRAQGLIDPNELVPAK